MKTIIAAFKKLPPIVQIIIAVITAYIVYTALKSAFNWIKLQNSNFQLQQESAVYEAQGQVLSYTPSQYQTFADTLENADGFLNDDEDAIYTVFRSMNNDLDVLELEKKYRASHSRSITDFLVDVFVRSEIDEVNAILRANNILRSY